MPGKPSACTRCGTPITQATRGRPRLYCPPCTRLVARVHNSTSRAGTRTCPTCGKPSPPRRQYCGTCRPEEVSTLRTGTCSTCRQPYTTRHPLQRYCSRRCNPRPSGNTTKTSSTRRGYDHAHRTIRARLLPLAIGTRCPLCGYVMTADQALDLDHSTPVALGSRAPGDRITHASCNRRAGQALGEALKRRTTPHSRAW